MENQSLYLLVHKHENWFKIGKTRLLSDRVSNLFKGNPLDLKRSYQVINTGSVDISKLERSMHHILHYYSVDDVPKCDGYTEWFQMDCFGKAIECLNFLNTFVYQSQLTLKQGIDVRIGDNNAICGCSVQEVSESQIEYISQRCINMNKATFENFQNLFKEIEKFLVTVDCKRDDMNQGCLMGYFEFEDRYRYKSTAEYRTSKDWDLPKLEQAKHFTGIHKLIANYTEPMNLYYVSKCRENGIHFCFGDRIVEKISYKPFDFYPYVRLKVQIEINISNLESLRRIKETRDFAEGILNLFHSILNRHQKIEDINQRRSELKQKARHWLRLGFVSGTLGRKLVSFERKMINRIEADCPED